MTDYRAVAAQAAARHGVPVGMFLRQINQESGFNPNARSPVGARGIAQFMPGTARGMGVNPDNPVQALDGAARMMGGLIRKYNGRVDLALAAYNAGAGAVAHYGGIPPFAETHNYVRSIMGGLGSRSTLAPSPLASRPFSMPAPTATDAAQTAAEARRRTALQTLLTPSPVLNQILKSEDLPGAQAIKLPPAPDAPNVPGALGLPSVGQGQLSPALLRYARLAPGADRPGVRTQPSVLEFVGKIGQMAGHPLVIGTGSNHSRMTVDGNVSDHWSGHAADIPARGAQLIQLGQLALIAAGMPRAQALRQHGGLYNVGGRQIIFNTHVGGDHTNHLHVGIR